MGRRRKREPQYEVELLLGRRRTGMFLPKNTGNWFSYRIVMDGEEIGTVEIGRGSVIWKPYRARRRGYQRAWSAFADRMETPLK